MAGIRRPVRTAAASSDGADSKRAVDLRIATMDFALSAEQKLLQETLRDFERGELLPNYASRDRDEDLPPALIRKLGELGVLAPMVESQLGGSGLDYVSLGIPHEEIARAG